MAMALLNDAAGAAWTVQKATAGTQSWLPNYVVQSQTTAPTRNEFALNVKPA